MNSSVNNNQEFLNLSDERILLWLDALKNNLSLSNPDYTFLNKFYKNFILFKSHKNSNDNTDEFYLFITNFLINNYNNIDKNKLSDQDEMEKIYQMMDEFNKSYESNLIGEIYEAPYYNVLKYKKFLWKEDSIRLNFVIDNNKNLALEDIKNTLLSLPLYNVFDIKELYVNNKLISTPDSDHLWTANTINKTLINEYKAIYNYLNYKNKVKTSESYIMSNIYDKKYSEGRSIWYKEKPMKLHIMKNLWEAKIDSNFKLEIDIIIKESRIFK